MEKIYKAKIKFNITKEHPDSEYVSDIKKLLEYEDTYYMDTEYFSDDEAIIEHIKNDMRLVAGGGYDTKHINNVNFDINKVNSMTEKMFGNIDISKIVDSGFENYQNKDVDQIENELIKKYLPKKYHNAVSDFYKDFDGYWIELKNGFISTSTGTQTIHEFNLADIKKEFKTINSI